MRRWWLLLMLLVLRAALATAQVETLPSSKDGPGPTQPPPRSDRDKEAGDSSSRDTRIDISPPKDDAKNHPTSSADPDGEDATEAPSDVQEFHPWDPHRAAKDVEVGDYYFKRRNYKGALERYKDALIYKENDAIATFRLAQTYEKLKEPDEALKQYETYLKILPHGTMAEDAQKSIERLKK